MSVSQISIAAKKDSRLIVTTTPYDHDITVFVHSLHSPNIYVTLHLEKDKLVIRIYEGKEHVQVIDKTEEKE